MRDRSTGPINKTSSSYGYTAIAMQHTLRVGYRSYGLHGSKDDDDDDDDDFHDTIIEYDDKSSLTTLLK